MNPKNLTFLEANEHTWITLRDAGYMMGLDGNTRSEMVRIICEEFQPGYATDLWCPPCVADMVTLLYRYFNEWREKNVAPLLPDELHQKKTALIESALKGDKQLHLPQPEPFWPIPDAAAEPVKVKANFPSHKKNQRR